MGGGALQCLGWPGCTSHLGRPVLEPGLVCAQHLPPPSRYVFCVSLTLPILGLSVASGHPSGLCCRQSWTLLQAVLDSSPKSPGLTHLQHDCCFQLAQLAHSRRSTGAQHSHRDHLCPMRALVLGYTLSPEIFSGVCENPSVKQSGCA